MEVKNNFVRHGKILEDNSSRDGESSAVIPEGSLPTTVEVLFLVLNCDLVFLFLMVNLRIWKRERPQSCSLEGGSRTLQGL